jgi:hypothetical protein
MQYTCKGISRRVRGVRAISITYSKYAPVVLGIQHEMHMGRVLLSSVSCPALQYIFILSYKRHGFRKTVIEHKMCVLIFFTTFA